jgi:uncharacterized membrane protein YjgN (DUF898 family)
MALTTGPWPEDASLRPNYPALPLFGWFLLAIVGQVLIVPSPWTTTRFCRFLCEQASLPNGKRFRFTGGPGDIWYITIGIGLLAVLPEAAKQAPGMADVDPVMILLLQVAFAIVDWCLALALIHWFVANVQSDDRRMSPEFGGSLPAFIGWQILAALSLFTVIGWAWVASGYMRWLCRSIQGNAAFDFTGGGLAILWRTLVFVVLCSLILPIPWMLRWLASWYVSHITVVPAI